MINRHPVDHLVKRDHASRRKDAALAQSTTNHLAPPACLGNEICVAGQDTPHRAAKALGHAECNAVNLADQPCRGDTQRDRRIEDPRTINVDPQAMGVRRVTHGIGIGNRDRRAAFTIDGVLQAKEPRTGEVGIVRITDRMGDLLHIEHPSVPLQGAHLHPSEDTHTTGLIVQEMRIGPRKYLVTTPRLGEDTNKVPHRPRKQQDCCLLAKDGRRLLLQTVHRRVLAEYVVANLCRSHRRPHGRGRVRHGIASKVNHCACHLEFCLPLGRCWDTFAQFSFTAGADPPDVVTVSRDHEKAGDKTECQIR